jgi:hypothetical protein
MELLVRLSELFPAKDMANHFGAKNPHARAI